MFSRAVNRSCAVLLQRRGVAFGNPLAINAPKVGNGVDGVTAFTRNKKTVATAADIAKLEIKEIPILEYGLIFSAAVGITACILTKIELHLYYKKFGYIYKDGLDFYNLNKVYMLRQPIEGLAK